MEPRELTGPGLLGTRYTRDWTFFCQRKPSGWASALDALQHAGPTVLPTYGPVTPFGALI